MVRDAEMHASEDKKKREVIEARNQADSLVYTTEKSLKEHGDKLEAVDKGNIENKIAELKKAMEGEEPEAINKAAEELGQAAHKLAELMYAQNQQGAEAEAAQAGAAPKDEKVVDADFEEVKK